jgi:hypothetical protein
MVLLAVSPYESVPICGIPRNAECREKRKRAFIIAGEGFQTQAQSFPSLFRFHITIQG